MLSVYVCMYVCMHACTYVCMYACVCAYECVCVCVYVYIKKLAKTKKTGGTGHTLGAAGGIEAVVACKALATGIIPPTINFKTADPDCDLDYTVNTAGMWPSSKDRVPGSKDRVPSSKDRVSASRLLSTSTSRPLTLIVAWTTL